MVWYITVQTPPGVTTNQLTRSDTTPATSNTHFGHSKEVSFLFSLPLSLDIGVNDNFRLYPIFPVIRILDNVEGFQG